MIRQICPNCLQAVEVPETSAGSSATCPQCEQAFPVPASYSPTVSPDVAPTQPPPPPPPPPPETYVLVPQESPVSPNRPTPPPGFVPPAPPPSADPPPPKASSVSLPAGYDHTVSVELQPPALAWISVIALTLVLISTSFSWVGAFPGDYRVYSQNAWQSVFGWFTTHTYFDETLAEESELRTLTPRNWFIMTPYLLMLVSTVGLSWAWQLWSHPTRDQLPRRVSWLATIWPSLPRILLALNVALLVLLLLQLGSGFGLETAIDQRIASQVAEKMDQASGGGKLPRPFLVGEITGRYNVQTTNVLWLTLGLHTLAVLTLGSWNWTQRRGSQSPPRVLFQC
ncbi:MAG: hypothetical protein LC104_05220 [Bacteroidales bacterium]|nr:hypothetical protein [Bacteroidales bacterium]